MGRSTFSKQHGQYLAETLVGAWRGSPPPLKISAERLEEITPLLLKSGSAALLYWRLKTRQEQIDLRADTFYQAYKLQKIQAAVHEHHLKKIFTVLPAAGIKPVLVKGWAIARLYPETGLRPFGDIDLCLPLSQHKLAREVLKDSAAKDAWIDWHTGFSALDREPESELMARLESVWLGDVEVFVPGAEDHLRMLCLHLLRHGAWRPLWLVDVAIALEQRTNDFDWKRFFGGDRRRAEWLVCVLALTHRLLGANVADTPVAKHVDALPSWLTTAVLRRWGRWFNSDYRDGVVSSLWRHRKKPMRLAEDLYFRFDPIRATVELNGSFNSLPRLPYQCLSMLQRTPEAFKEITKLIWRRPAQNQ